MVRRARRGQHVPGRNAMKVKLQPLLLALTVINLGLFGYVVSQQGAIAAPGADGILRGKGLEIVDDGGKRRATIEILAPSRQKDGSMSQETVILRLIAPDGRPSVKLAAMPTGSGFSFTDGKGLSYVQLLAENDDPKINIVDKTGKKVSTLP
jgi:hypothetical protein